ncbi:sensor histidine kinase ComP [Paenibacillus sp. CCS19]|uniref:ATP-binding protein n=1 Tax=Paenibacillus sp. CCS19 TaxID=3158387 RepID=UPI00256752CF|nr:ATP-binding protein [Paenibacillus cellulosilyticus]GMK39984.1 sensor histidine kinase ComP [Paenibacillus cellulosilyticus]
MTNRNNRSWIVLFIMLILAGWFTILQFTVPYIGINSKLSNGKWLVTYIDTESWGAKAGIQVDDIISQVDNLPPNDESLTKFYGIASARSVEVIRNGHRIQFDFTDFRKQPVSFNQTVIPMASFILLFTFSSFIVYKKPADRSAFLLILFLMSVAIGYLAAGGSARLDLFSGFIMRLMLTFAPVFFLHFLHDYFSKLGIQVIHQGAIFASYVLVSVWNLFIFIQVYGVFSFLQAPGSASRVALAIFIAGMIIALLVQVRMYIRYRNTTQQALLKYMMLGNIGSFLPLILFVGLPFLLNSDNVINAGVASSFLLLLPLTYLYLVASNQLLDIEFIVSRLRYFCLIALLPTLLISIGIGLAFADRGVHTLQWLQVILVVYVSTVLTLYFKEVLDRKFRNKVIKGAHQFEKSLESFSHRVSSVMKVCDLEQCLMDELFSLLPIQSVGFIDRDLDGNAIALKRCRGEIPFEMLLPDLQSGLLQLSPGDSMKTKYGSCYLIGQGRGTQHFVWISDKENHMEYNHDEKVWLRTIITYAGFVHQNLQLIEGLVQDLDSKKGEKTPPWVLRLLFRLSENERRKLASDLHDSALQDQLLWYRKLEAITNDETMLPAATRVSLEDIREGLLDVIHQIRETCNELRPPFLKEMGAIEAIENLCTHAQLNANYTITFKHQDIRMEMDDEYVLTLYRITQELLRNGMKHSKATHVELFLHYEHQFIRYRYRDNGIGMELDRLQSSFQHMGLSGIRERVSGLEGETYYRTAPGEGLEVEIILPLPDEESCDYQTGKEESA